MCWVLTWLMVKGEVKPRQVEQLSSLLLIDLLGNPEVFQVLVVSPDLDGVSYCQGSLAAYLPVTGQGRLNGCGLARAD
jgi:hypothetical protein